MAFIVDLFCGLGGWAEGFLAERFDVVGFDIECHDYGTGGYPGQLVIQDVLTLHGKQFKDAAGIVASPPCQAYSYRAMPWKRAKALPPPDNTLFEACFRIQREASEAAGRHVPMIVENVRGAEKWVGHARWHFGSFYLWGDVPALMPTTSRSRKSKHVPLCEVPKGTGKTSWFFGNSKHEGRNYGMGGPEDNPRDDEQLTEEEWERYERERKKEDCENNGPGYICPAHEHLKFPKRKAASAMIAKIPFPLANYIARQWSTKSAESETPSPALLD